MMKSFFKKLSLVMALAMVVSMMAPAASAFAATATVALKDKTPVATHALEVGAEEDYCFLGAPKNWKELGWKWTSSNPEVATVDEVTGLTKGVADGVATITITVGDVYTAAVEVTVGAGEAVVEALVAEQTAHNKVKLTFANTKITKADIEKNLKVAFIASGYEIEAQLINTIGDVKDGVVTVELVDGAIIDGVEYKFSYNEGEATDSFVATLGAVASVEIVQKAGKYVDEDIVLDVVYKNSTGVDITELVDSGYVTYDAASAPNNEYWLSDNVLYFTAEYATTVIAEYHGFDKDNNEFVITSKPFPVVAKKKPDYAVNFNGTPAWTMATAAPADWTKDLNHDIAVGDDAKEYQLFIKTKDNFDGDVVFPTTVSNGEFRYQSTKPSVLYVTEKDGYLMPNSQGEANVLVYFTPENGKEVLVTVVPVTVSPARSVKNVAIDNTSATLSTVAGYNTATFKLTLKDGLGTLYTGATADVKCTTKTKFATPVVTTSGQSNDKGEITITVKVDNTMVADAGSQTFNFTATVNGITKNFSVTVKDPKGVGTADDPYTNLSYGLSFAGDKAIKVEKADPLVLTASLAVLSNGAAIGNQELAGAKGDIKDAEAGKFYYEVKFNNNDITKNVTTTATGTVLNIALTSTASDDSLTIVDYAKGVGSYTVTIYKAMAKANDKDNKAAYFAPVKSLTQEVTYGQPAITLVDGHKESSTESGAEAVLVDCFKFKYGTNDIDLTSADYKYTVDANVVPNAGIIYFNSVTIYKKVGDNLYVKYNVAIGDYVTLN